MASKTAHRRRNTPRSNRSTSDSPPSPTPSSTPNQKLHNDLERVKQEALASGFSQEDFNTCLQTAAKHSKLTLQPRRGHGGGQKKKDGRQSCCSRLKFCFKLVWIGMLLMLAFALFTAAYKPLTFFMHKILHERLYHFSRPIRLALMSSLPYLEALGLDFFLTNDCILENPLLNDTQRCPCLSVKRPLELTLNGSPFPSDILQQDTLQQLYVLRNATQIPSDFSLGKVVSFSEEYFTNPLVCWQITSEGSKGVVEYSQLFDKNLMKKLLRSKHPWAFTWLECPDERNPYSLRVLFPPPTYIPPHTHTSTNTMFTLTTQWAPTTHSKELFPNGKVIAMNILGGEVRIVPHPQDQACFDVCSGMKEYPVLKAGDVFVFDHRLWTYEAYTWSRTLLAYSVAIEHDTDDEDKQT